MDDSPRPRTVDDLLAEARATLPPRPTADELDGLLSGDALVVDIRPIGIRTAEGALPGALVVDRNVLEWRLDPASPHRLPEVTDHHQTVVVVCNDGYASSLAASSLQRLGLHRATDLEGGYRAWAARRRDKPSG
ncbi:MAG: rhodanese-like domain-containing protein [Acidimicrobiales bacterium]